MEDIRSIKTSKAFLKRLLDIEKLKYCRECGTCTASCPVAWIVPKYYNPRSLLQKGFLDLRGILAQVGLWLCTRCYRCYDRCPQMLDLPRIFSLMRDLAIEYLPNPENNLREVLKLIREEIPLAAVYGWLCLHPHEAERERMKVDRLAIDVLERFVDGRKREKPSPIPKTREEKIAIIGSGPAGLTAAYELVKKEYLVTVFESLPEPGGMLRVGIPEYRLPKEVLDADIKYIKDLGVEIKTNTAIGKDLPFNDLLKEEEYKAIFIATGAHKSRKLRVEGEDMEGVMHALDLLRQVNLKRRPKLGERVVVIGGGNVAMDSARTALRLGAETVQLACLESKQEMPAHKHEIQEAVTEGVVLNLSWGSKKILGNGKKVTGVELIRCVSVFDKNGKFKPSFDETVTKILEADTVILAIGHAPDLSFLGKEINVLGGGAIAVDPMTMETSLSGVFAGGDATSGPATVVEAIAAGKRAAISINRYLRGACMHDFFISVGDTVNSSR